MSFQVVAFVPNFKSFDLDVSATMCFLSAASFLHCYLSRSAYFYFSILSWCCRLCSLTRTSSL
jgi:hypothetical protein